MEITILTMFPETYEGFLKMPLIKRAAEKGIAEIRIVDIREFAEGSFRRIDDSPYGGGAGMIMRYPPVFKALESVRTENSTVILTSPAGETYRQETAHALAEEEQIILIAGHYEGIDARILDHTDRIFSLGDYILSGGELATQIIADSVIRLLPGIIRSESTAEESFENGLLEYPQYTRPAEYNGKKVPEVLLGGNHEAIRRYRLEESLRLTLQARPDLLEGRECTEEEKEILKDIRNEGI